MYIVLGLSSRFLLLDRLLAEKHGTRLFVPSTAVVKGLCLHKRVIPASVVKVMEEKSPGGVSADVQVLGIRLALPASIISASFANTIGVLPTRSQYVQ